MNAELPRTKTKHIVKPEDLAELRLLANADLKTAADLLQECSVQVLSKEEVLIMPDVTNQALYLVLNGRLRVHLDSPWSDPVQFIETGEAVGEMSLIGEKPTSAYVIADAPSKLLVIEQEVFWSLVYAEHAIARNMLLMVVERMRANNSLVAEGVRLREQYRRQTKVDTVTGLYNRRALEELLRRQLLRSSMNKKPLAVMMVEIDSLRRLNKEFGRTAGDHAIYTVAQMIQNRLRPTDIAARMEGGVFAMILPECNEAGAQAAANRLREGAAEILLEMKDGSILPPVAISIGIATMRPFEKANELLEAAEQALEQSKRYRGAGSAND